MGGCIAVGSPEGTTVLVTGVTGFIGSHTCVDLLVAGYRVVGVDNFAHSSPSVVENISTAAGRELEFVRLDVRDRAGLDWLFASHPVDAVLHLAVMEPADNSASFPLEYYYDANLNATLSLLAAMHDRGLQNLIFSSSCSVYGSPESVPVREDAQPRPANPYARTRWMCEQIAVEFCARYRNRRVISLRCFNPAGRHTSGLLGADAHANPSAVIPRLAQVAAGLRAEFTIYGDDYPTADGTGVRDYVHVMDIAEGHRRALEHLPDEAGYRVINLGSGYGTSVKELVRTFSVTCGHDLPCRVVKGRPGEVPSLVADPSLAQELLGWQPRRELLRICRDAWSLQQRDRNNREDVAVGDNLILSPSSHPVKGCGSADRRRHVARPAGPPATVLKAGGRDTNVGTRGPQPRITVIGTGYLGATHAVCMAELGSEVLGVDVDAAKVDKLAAGELPFFEQDLERLLRRNLEAGRLRFTTSFEDVAQFGDVHFLCVGTPQSDSGRAVDLSHLYEAVRQLAPMLCRDCLVVGKSTVSTGTAAALDVVLARAAPAGREHGGGVELAWNPEFLREGFAVRDTLRPDRLVFGVDSPRAEERLREVFAPIIAAGTPVVVTDYATAELVKVAANSFLATKISFINAMAEICEAVDADVTKLVAALAHDSRIGGKFLRPGVGFGGGCLPKDIRAFMARADEVGAGRALAFLREVDAINLRRRARVVDLVRELLDGTLSRRRIAVLGAAFKPDSDDIRDSPALAVAAALCRLGADVVVHDPAAIDNARRAYPELNYATTATAAAADADAVIVLTEWRTFREIDPLRLAEVVRQRIVVDARYALDADRWRSAGWIYRAPGYPTPAHGSSVPRVSG